MNANTLKAEILDLNATLLASIRSHIEARGFVFDKDTFVNIAGISLELVAETAYCEASNALPDAP
ncbi:hypothetical protein PXK56_18405 [Phaeobacter gallaeciensis]|uniref:hypothetical protein n=1 Tax=Phaeobacter gallaeciensis TaxID=60890 RepID=UPI0023805315|nr:hypothetical protein [Phaeobacter gallaeciensis]MDE4297160.1 hypothetical protein [Phaeobacter gallaeciensis]